MTKYYSVFLLLQLFFYNALAQEIKKPVKCKDFVFEEVKLRKDLLYKTNLPVGVKQKYYSFDFYEAAKDSSAYRPLIIWLHGGGFKFGKKTSGGLPIWGKSFAQRGYVCASINYRLSKKHPLKNFTDLVAACADAVADANDAIQYFKLHYKEYRIDTSKIILGGNSAGGMIALQAIYSSSAEMSALAHNGDSTNTVSKMHNPRQIVAVINYWGALFNLNWLNNANIPIVSVHGKKDRVVPADNNKTGMYGSIAIHRAADSLQIPNAIKVYDNYAHELQRHFNPLFAGSSAKKRWREAGQFTADFLYTQLFSTK